MGPSVSRLWLNRLQPLSEDGVSDWIWDQIDPCGDPYVCNKCHARWVDPDFEQPVPWERLRRSR